MKSRLSSAFAAAGCALIVSVAAANAAIITFDVTGNLSPANAAAGCSPVCALGGTFVLDNTTDAISSINITLSGALPTLGPFNTLVNVFNPGNGTTSVLFIDTPTFNSTSNTLVLNITGVLGGFTGGALNPTLTRAGTPSNVAQWQMGSPGALTAQVAAVPGPMVGAGLPGLVLAFGGFVWWRRRRRATA